MTNARQTDMMVSIEKGCEEEEYTAASLREDCPQAERQSGKGVSGRLLRSRNAQKACES